MDEHSPTNPQQPATTPIPQAPEVATMPAPGEPTQLPSPVSPSGLTDPELLPGDRIPETGSNEQLLEEEDGWEIEEELPSAEEGGGTTEVSGLRVRRRKRPARPEAAELRLLGRRALCRQISDIAPQMLKTVKLRVLGRYLPSTRGLEDEDLTQVLRKDAAKLADRARILKAMTEFDPDYDRDQLKAIIFDILLQEETFSIEENRLEEKVIEFEKDLVRRSKTLDFFDPKKHDPDRWHHYDTYRIVLEAAWANDGRISPDEARLLAVLRKHLNISREEHWLISALLKRFPKEKCALHTPDEVNEVRKELQREGLLWSYRDDNNHNVDVIPSEIAAIVRREVARNELQRTNYRRLSSHDSIVLTDLRELLHQHNLDRYGSKGELIERLVASDIRPSELLGQLDKDRLATMCSSVGLKTSGNKPELIDRLINFYDDLTFVERVTKDDREGWYNNYELLAGRAYAELRAKKLITKDLEIEHMFEGATTFLFEARLQVPCDRSQKENRADGRLPLDGDQSILWDCKSAEGPVNLQDHLDSQFDGYLRKEREAGRQPLAFLVIGPGFTPQSIKLAHQYKARTNWDVALLTAEGLKHLADRWSATEPGKPFPIRLLNRTEVIDKDRAEFLLSLA